MNRLNRVISYMLLLALAFSSLFYDFGTSYAAGLQAGPQPEEQVAFLVKYKNKNIEALEHSISRVKSELELNKLQSFRDLNRSNVAIVAAASKKEQKKAMTALKQDPAVDFVQPDFTLQPLAVVEVKGTNQGNHSPSGPTGSDAFAKASLMQEWQTTKGEGVVIGVIDTGIDIVHPALQPSIFVNSNEIPGNGIDDDGNGYIDDINGWDFANHDATVYDDPKSDQHGTHVAGIIAAQTQAKENSGIAPKAKLLPLKVVQNGDGYTSSIIEAIEYASALGVKIINMSLGSKDYNPALEEAMRASGMLFVTSAGNNGEDLAEAPIYPAAFALSNNVAVTALNQEGSLLRGSNYGLTTGLAAPGEAILSTMPGNKYKAKSGTSAAAAYVTGVAALIQSSFPDLGIDELVARLKASGVMTETLQGKVAFGAVDASRALVKEYEQPKETPVLTERTIVPSIEAGSYKTMAAVISPQLQEMIHYGEEGVSPSTGNYSKTFVDLSYKFAGFEVNFSRTYNSKEQAGGRFGSGWTFGFEGSITDNGSVLVVKLPNGGAQMFQKNGDGTFEANDSYSTLVKQADGTYILTTKDQYTYGFNKNNWISWMADEDGNKITIDVDGLGRVRKVTDAVGRATTIAYNANDRIVSITDPMNRIVRYEYNSLHQLSKVIDPSGHVIGSYQYDLNSLLVKISNSKQEQLESIAYDPNKKVIRYVNAFGNIYNYVYEPSKTTITDTEGNVTEKWFDNAFYVTKSKDPEGGITTVTYQLNESGFNQFGQESTVTDRFGNKWTYTRDERGNITVIENPDGSKSEYTYNEKNNLVSEKDESGDLTMYVYDSSDNKLIRKMQALDSEKAASPGDFAITQYLYYGSGELAALGYKVKGLLKSEINPEGNAVTYTYDKNGYQSSITDAEGNKTVKTNNLLGWNVTTISPQGHRTDHDYDINGRLIRTTGALEDTTRYVYDGDGRKVQEISPVLYTSESDGLNDATPSNVYRDGQSGMRFTYEPDGKVKTETDAEGYTTTYTYDSSGNVLTKTMPSGAVYSYTYDGLKRVLSESFSANKDGVSVTLKTHSYPNAVNGKRVEVLTEFLNEKDKAVTTTTSDYDDREIEKVEPDGGITTTEYYPDGQIESVTDPMGFITYHQYDGLGRETGKWQAVEAGKYMYTGKSYDLAGRLIEERIGKDQVSQYKIPADDRLAKKKYGYDGNGKLVLETDSSGLKKVTTYNKDGFKASESIYTSDKSADLTEYFNNPSGKVLKQSVSVQASDLQGYSPTDMRKIKLVTVYDYDLNGNLIEEVTADGRLTQYQYDRMNRQTKTTEQGIDETGQPIMITTSKQYNWEGDVVSATDERGGISTNTYNERGFLVKEVDPAGYAQLFDYDRGGRMITKVLPNNVVANRNISEMARTEFVYDHADRVKLQIEIFPEKALKRGGAIITESVTRVVKAFLYDLNGQVIKELKADGYAAGVGTSPDEKIRNGYGTLYKYNGLDKKSWILDPVGQLNNNKYTTKYEYDGMGRLIRESDVDGIIHSTYYDDGGRATSKTVRKAVDDLEQLIESHTYDKAGRVSSKTDGNGNVERYTYNAFDKVRQIIYPSDSTVGEWKVDHQYDVMENLVKKSDNAGRIDLYTYDQEGRELTRTTKSSTTGVSITTSTAYDVAGNKRFEKDANGKLTENTYDELERLLTVSFTVSSLKKTTRYAYDKNDNKIQETDWLGNSTYFDYDAINRLYQKRDAYGHVIEKLGYNADSLQVLSMDALDQEIQFEYDRNHRKIATIDEEGSTDQEEFNDAGLLIAKIDGKGNRTEYEYDAFDRLTQVTNSLGETTVYTYDLAGNMITQTDGLGNVSTFEYNVRNKMSRRIDPGGVKQDDKGVLVYTEDKLERYTYGPNGLMKTKKDRSGNTTHYEHDYRGLLLSEKILRPSEQKPAKENAITYTYDGNGNELSMVDVSGRTSCTYDEQGRVTSKFVLGLGTSVYTYDNVTGLTAGHMAETTTDVKGNVTERQFDRVGRLVNVLSNGSSVVQYTYLKNGSRSQLTSPGGLTTQYTYFKNNLLKKLVNLKGGIIQDSFDYTYDEAKNQTSKTETLHGALKGVTQFSYDPLNRLSKVQEPNGQTTDYTFDESGNRKTETVVRGSVRSVTTYKYDEQNLLTSTNMAHDSGKVDIVRYSHDSNGNMVKKSTESLTLVDPANPQDPTFGIFIPGQENPNERIDEIVAGTSSFVFNDWNQLVTSLGKETVKYKYNGDGYRVEKTTSSGTTRYLYEGDKVVLELNERSEAKAQNIYGKQLVTRKNGADQVYYAYNGHGDVISLRDSSGQLRTTYDYDAFGNPIDTATKFYNASGQLTTGTGKIDSPIRYAGYQYDNETGLYYLNARYYDADIARFISEDTYRGDPKDPLSLNLYTYVNNEPMMYDDPTGHMPKWLKKAAKVTFKVAKFAVLDDIMTLANPKATLGQKIMAGVSLLPAGKIIKVAQVAIKVTKTVKATNAVSKNVSLVRLTSSKSGPTFASRKSTKNVVDEYGTLSKNKNIPGQAHHLNQDAAYKKVIPTKKGVSSKLKGNAFKEIDSPHYNAHENMESFWNQYRKGGDKFNDFPTNLQYSKALVTSLKAAGKTKDEAMQLARAASKQRIQYGLLGGAKVPRVPGKVNQVKRSKE